jgi:hypothetical protein
MLVGSSARAVSATTVLGLVISAFGVATPASAAPPAAPTGLTDEQPNVTTTMLTWARSADATKYEVVVDNTSDFSSPLERQTTTNSTFVPREVLPEGGIYWRVRAINAANESSDWSFEQFVQGRVGKPEPSSPPNGQPIPAGTPPVLTWKLVPGATDYKVDVSREASFTPATTQTIATQSTSVVPPKTLDKGLWYWRVTASRGSGLASDPSDAWTFTIPTLPTPVLVSPPNGGSEAVEDVVLSWAPVVGAEKYEVDISRDQDFPSAGPGVTNGPDWVTMPRATTFGAKYSPMPTLDNAVTWYWRVRAVDFDGNRSDWQSVPFVFKRAWGDMVDGIDGPADLQDIPTLVTPAEDGPETISGPFGFSWTAVEHASDYEINVGTDPDWSPSTFTRCRVHGTSYTPYQFRYDIIGGRVKTAIDDECVPSPGRINYWRVRALDRPFSKMGVLPGVQGEFSSTQSFRWNPAAAANLSPTGGATVTTPTLSWDAVTGAETYKIEVTDGEGTTTKAETHSTSFTVLTRPSVIKNPYTWTMVALDAAKNPVSPVYASSSMTFDLAPGETQADWQNLSSSAHTLRAPDLRWAPITGADHYRVRVRRDGEGWLPISGENLFEDRLDFPAMTDISDELFASGLYHWQVAAYTKEGAQIGDRSPEWSFNILKLDAVTGQQLALSVPTLGTADACTSRLNANGVDGPRCSTVPTSPVLSWSRVPGASLYQVWVNTDASFTTLMEPESSFAATSNLLYVPNLSSQVSAYPDNDAASPTSAYYWAIVPCKSVTSCATSVRGNLGNATNAFVKKSLPVVPKGPGRPADAPDAATAELTATDITFEWEDYLATNRAVEPAATVTGEQSDQSAMKYRIEVATDVNFTDILETKEVDQTTFTSSARLYPEGPLYWRVRAVDGDENQLTWSRTWRVNKRNPLPELSEPAPGAWVSSTSPLKWAAMPAVDGYQVEVYKNNQVAPSNLVCEAPASKAARYSALACTKPFAPTSAADPDDQYRWRIRRIDSSGLANPWSAERTFEVTAPTLTLLSPVLDSQQIPNGPVLTWSPVPGAREYRVDLRNETTGQNLSPATTDATAYAWPTAMPSGTYRWTVTAFDAAGGAVATQSSRFSVDAGLSAASATVISAPEGSAVGKVLTSTPPVWNQDGVTNAYQWLRNGSVISGATSPTYLLTVADYAKSVSLRVTGRKAGYTDGVSVSNAIGVTAGGALQNLVVPTI